MHNLIPSSLRKISRNSSQNFCLRQKPLPTVAFGFSSDSSRAQSACTSLLMIFACGENTATPCPLRATDIFRSLILRFTRSLTFKKFYANLTKAGYAPLPTVFQVTFAVFKGLTLPKCSICRFDTRDMRLMCINCIVSQPPPSVVKRLKVSFVIFW